MLFKLNSIISGQVHNIIRGAFGKLTGPKPERRVLVFIFFVFISTIFWFLSALGREYTARLRYPVRYTNFPENMVMVGELPSTLELTVNAYGYTLLKYHVSRRLHPVVFDVNSFTLNRLPDTETRNFYMLFSVATNRIAGQLGADIEILDIKPDSLFLRFTDKVSRKLPVKPLLDLGFESQFMIKGNIEVEPDSVTVSGPLTLLDTMRFVPTLPLHIGGISGSLKQTVNLPDHDMLDFSESRVTVNVPVDQFTEASLRVPLEVVNLPDTLIMKTFPSSVTVSFLVALTDYDKVNSRQFVASVHYDSLPSATGRLPVRLEKQPEFIKSVRFSPQNVDFIIEKPVNEVNTYEE